MTIIKTGQVIINDEGIFAEGFTFDGGQVWSEGNISYGAVSGSEALLLWAITKLQEELKRIFE